MKLPNDQKEAAKIIKGRLEQANRIELEAQEAGSDCAFEYADGYSHAVNDIRQEFADLFESRDIRFNRAGFMEACGAEEEGG